MSPGKEPADELTRIARQAMLEQGLEPDFPLAATAQAQAITAPTVETGGAVRDLRSLLWCSIDNDDSRDLDQLSVALAGTNGTVKVLVAVADVDSRVTAGSAIDAHASTNTTSVYTAAQIFPMLPERLSTDLTSLAENADRVSLVIEMSITGAGAVCVDNGDETVTIAGTYDVTGRTYVAGNGDTTVSFTAPSTGSIS